jgi:2-C-methyl-D-erythritol 4-phosphate cytidylyltransferase/2-C-methyl-D-erythritol 2,4-cyclodiphosphate synthase
MTFAAIVLAAGQGARSGVDKVWVRHEGRPLWAWSLATLAQHPEVVVAGLVVAPERLDEARRSAHEADFVVAGGPTRKESCRLGLLAVPLGVEAVLVHDAARPFVTGDLVGRVIEGVRRHGAACPVVPLVDTVKLVEDDGGLRGLDRSALRAVQTPQGALRGLLERALSLDCPATDEAGLIEASGRKVAMVEGDPRNVKITYASDLAGLVGAPEFRTGIGYDVHAFSRDPARPLVIGGVEFEDCPGLEGHSDADVLAHAVVDALLGAACLGDIGQLYPDTDSRWRGSSSMVFLHGARQALADHGWEPVHVDSTVVAARPRIMPKRDQIQAALAVALGLDPDRVSVKATTNEGLGALGRGEGVAAWATATVRRIGPVLD